MLIDKRCKIDLFVFSMVLFFVYLMEGGGKFVIL